MSIYSSTVTLRILHPLYDQIITLPRLGTTIADILDCLPLPSESRKQYHLSFDGVWLGKGVSIQDVSK